MKMLKVMEMKMHDPYDTWSPRTKEEHDNYWQEEYRKHQESLIDENQREPDNPLKSFKDITLNNIEIE